MARRGSSWRLSFSPSTAKSFMTNEKIFYTYAYLREDRTPYYIGKGQGNRAYREGGRRGAQTPKDKSRIILLKKEITEEEAFKHEIYMIAVLGRKDLGTGILRNLTDGGEGSSGCVVTGETKKKLSKAALGRKLPEGIKEKISKATKGRKRSLETRGRISAVAKQRLGEKNSFFGKVHSDITKKRISDKNIGRNHGTMWITNGENSKRVDPDLPMPEGYWKGRTFT